MTAGVVYFVGAGPGAPGLVTVRAMELLARADVVVHDADVPALLLDACPATCARYLADGDASADLVAHGAGGSARVIVRLVVGDPLAFGRLAGEIAAVTRAGLAREVVPGIEAAWALPAFAGVPFVQGGADVVAFARARGADAPAWDKLTWAVGSVVLETDAAGVADAATRLLGEGRNPATPAAVVIDATLPTQRVKLGTLADIATRARALKAATLILAVGDPVAAHARSWFEELPLKGKRILVTRTREQASGTASTLRERGAAPVVVPTIETRPPADGAPLSAAVAALPAPGAYDWVAFTSANGVDYTFRELARQGRDARAFGSVQIAAIGPATAAALGARGVKADLVAKELKGEGLAEVLLAAITARFRSASNAPRTHARVLLPRAREAREVFPDALRAAGHAVDVVTAYETHAPAAAAGLALAGLLEARQVDAALFTSSSTVDNLCALLGERAAALLAGVCLASIGPITTATLERRGLRADVTAAESTVPGLVLALERFFRAG